MMQLIKGQSHFPWAFRNLSKAFETCGGICKFKLILPIFGTNKCADYIVLHDCKIVMFNCEQIFAFMENSGIKHTDSFICFVTPFLFDISRVTWNYWLSLDDVYSHKWCPSDTFEHKFYNECVPPYHVTRVWLQIMTFVLDPFECLFFLARLRSHSGTYRRLKFLVSLCMDIPQTFSDIKKSDIHKIKLIVSMFIILRYVNNYGIIAIYKKQLERSCMYVIILLVMEWFQIKFCFFEYSREATILRWNFSKTDLGKTTLPLKTKL